MTWRNFSSLKEISWGLSNFKMRGALIDGYRVHTYNNNPIMAFISEYMSSDSSARFLKVYWYDQLLHSSCYNKLGYHRHWTERYNQVKLVVILCILGIHDISASETIIFNPCQYGLSVYKWLWTGKIGLYQGSSNTLKIDDFGVGWESIRLSIIVIMNRES